MSHDQHRPDPPPEEDHREQAPGQVSCTVCMKQVPRSEAASAEGMDQVWYFCGPDCFERWHPDFARPPLRR